MDLNDPQVDCRSSYDAVSEEYAARIYDELAHKPFDRELLDKFGSSVRNKGTACDIGCGPGHIARYLREQGVEVCGIDLSPEMVRVATRLNPGITFSEGNMLTLDLSDESLSGITSFYSIIHIPRKEVVYALREMKRALKPDGLLLLAFHIGDDAMHMEEWLGHKVSIDFHFFTSEEMTGYLKSAEFEIEEVIEREPYPEVEHQSRRSYILARKPAPK